MLKRSQAALEFLTTYAWAFLVILIMVGALAYFGILSPSQLLPDRCNFGSEISCDKNRMVVNNENPSTLTMRLANSFGTPVVITRTNSTDTGTKVISDIGIGSCEIAIDGVVFDDEGAGPPNDVTEINWNSDTTITFSANCDGGPTLVEKEKIKMSIEIAYYPATLDSTYGKIIFGEIFTTIQ